MSTITKPMALDESFNTTESTSRNQADVLAGIEEAIRQGFGQVASAVEYDNTDSGLTADNVQDAIDEVDDTVDGLVDDVAEISSDIESTQIASGNPITLTDAAPINAESLVVELEPKQEGSGDPSPTNIRPITGYTECEVDDCGKNRAKDGYAYNVTANGTVESSSLYNSCIAYVESGKTYTHSLNGSKTNIGVIAFFSDLPEVGSVSYNGERQVNIDGTFVAPINGYAVIRNPTSENKIQVEQGSTATSYEPYHSSNATIQFGQTVYGGSVDFLTGVLTVDMAIQTITSVSDRVGAYQFYSSALQGAKSTSYTVEDAIANEMPYNKSSYGSNVFGFVTNNGNLYIRLPFLVSDTKEAANTFLITNPLQVCYPLATPFTIQLTPDELKLLKGTNHITTNGTTINLGYQPDNVIGDAKEKADKINFSEIVKYTISGNTAELIPLVIDGTAHNNIPIVTDITKYRMLCVELVLKPSTAITGVYFSAIAFTDGIYLPSGISIPVYIPAGMFYANVTINPDGNGGFQLSYTAINQSQSTPPDYYSIRVRAFNQY